jgi:hypothetical protein
MKFIAAVAGVIAVGGFIGWQASAPPFQPMRPTLKTTFHPVDPNAPPSPPAATDGGAGVEARQRLRAAVLNTANALRADPCSDEAKAQFLTAVQAYMGPFMKAQHESPGERGPQEWRTADDEPVHMLFRDMPEQGYVSGPEFYRALAASSLQGRIALYLQQFSDKKIMPDAPKGPTLACLRSRGQAAPMDPRESGFHQVRSVLPGSQGALDRSGERFGRPGAPYPRGAP